jgi:alpha-ketoglutarate-dependent taurine dioxygenase
MKFHRTHLAPFGLLLEAAQDNADLRQLDHGELRKLFERKQLIVLRGFKALASAEDFASYCESWGEIALWPFGKVLELKEQAKPEDHIFDSSYVPLHWDGMYRKQVPEIQIFQCVSSPGLDCGGRTTFTHTPAVLKRVSEAVRSAWSQVTGVYERKMEYYDSKTRAPLIDKHPTRGFPVIRFCEPPSANDPTFINHSQFAFEGVSASETADFLRSLRAELYAPENFYAHEWQAGDIVITDNYTLLHGREAFTSGAPRHLRRVQVLGRPALDNPHLVSTQ